MNDEDKNKELEKNAKALSLDLADKLEKDEISLEEIAKQIDDFLTEEKNA